MTKISAFFRSDIGNKRSNNEDAVDIFEPKEEHQLRRSGRLYVVADGLGGHEKGEFASAFAVETLIKTYFKNPEIPPDQRLRNIIRQINDDLINFARSKLSPGEKSATTIVAAVIRNDTLQVAHVGDSRAYLLRDGEITQLTNDHSFVNELIRARAMSEEEANASPYRNRLMRSVGGSLASLDVDVTEPIPLKAGDIILLCTDGLTQYATSNDILELSSPNDARTIVDKLIQFANDRGGTDNTTICAINYGRKSVFSALNHLPFRRWAIPVIGLVLFLAFTLIASRLWSVNERMIPTASPEMVHPTFVPTSSKTATTLPEIISQTTSIPAVTPVILFTELPNQTSTVSDMVDCMYTVEEGDIAGLVVENFETDLLHLYYEDGSQDDFRIIYPGSVLILDDIPDQICVDGGGSSLPASIIASP
jgi:protein phosphatase